MGFKGLKKLKAMRSNDGCVSSVVSAGSSGSVGLVAELWPPGSAAAVSLADALVSRYELESCRKMMMESDSDFDDDSGIDDSRNGPVSGVEAETGFYCSIIREP